MSRMLASAVLATTFAVSVPVAAAEVLCPVEVGGGGVKARVIELSFDAQCNMVTKTLFSADDNTNLAKTMQDRRLTPEAIRASTDAVVKLTGQMQASHPDCRSLVAVSSGVGQAINTSELTQAVTGAGIRDISVLTPAQEAEYGFKGSIPASQRGQALLFDIGGGNTNIGYVDASGAFRNMEVAYGSNTLSTKAGATGLPPRFGTAKIVMGDVLPRFTDELKSHPDVARRGSVYWIGGTAWATATWSHPEQSQKAAVALTVGDLDDFLAALDKGQWSSRQPPADITPETRAAWDKDWASVQRIFSAERLIAGVTLMKALMTDGVSRSSVTFPRYGQWLWAYSVEQFKVAGICSR